ncbi:hypothetical protein ABBQ38_007952 [Trebouxia sp. C0009 RCD-2024]
MAADALLSGKATYMSFMAPTFQEMVDVLLIVEGVRLPAHKAILAANSKVLAEAFTSQAPAASTAGLPELPLPEDSLEDTTRALTYLYRHCVFSTEAQSIKSQEDGKAIIRFSHKYAMQGMLDASETYLISKIQAYETTPKAVASWTALAEKYGLSKLLANCEHFFIHNTDLKLWKDMALVVDGISPASLLRNLRGLQLTRSHVQGRVQHTGVVSYNPTVSTLVAWQQGK